MVKDDSVTEFNRGFEAAKHGALECVAQWDGYDLLNHGKTAQGIRETIQRMTPEAHAKHFPTETASTPLPVDPPSTKHRTWTELKAEMDAKSSVDLEEKIHGKKGTCQRGDPVEPHWETEECEKWKPLVDLEEKLRELARKEWDGRKHTWSPCPEEVALFMVKHMEFVDAMDEDVIQFATEIAVEAIRALKEKG